MRFGSFICILTVVITAMLKDKIVGILHPLGLHKITTKNGLSNDKSNFQSVIWNKTRSQHRPATTFDDLRNTFLELCNDKIIGTSEMSQLQFSGGYSGEWLDDPKHVLLSGRANVTEMSELKQDLGVVFYDSDGSELDSSQFYLYYLGCDKAYMKITNLCTIFPSWKNDPLYSAFCIDYMMLGSF